MRLKLPVAALLLLPWMAHAECKCPVVETEDLKEQATYIFSGTVTDTGKDKSGARKISFDVDETFKGNPGSEMELTDVAEADCAMDVREGENWIVYVRWQWGADVTSRCFGTKRVDHAQGDIKTLGPADSWKAKQYPKLRDACMGHREVGCCLNSVKTMAKGGFLPEPETGCEEGTIPDRLPCPTSYTWCIPVSEAGQRHVPASR